MPSSAWNKFNAFVEAAPEKVHNLGADAIVVALCAAANAPVATNSVLADLTQISYTNCSSRAVTVTTSSQTSGTYTLDANDVVLTASGGNVGPFRYVVFYNDTATNKELLGWLDYGSDVTLASGESITISPNASGLFTLA